MVHALKEAWRVLKPDGSMVDVRPLCVDVPLEVVYDNNSMPAGIVDLSPDIGRDVASDKALAAVIEKRLFYEEQLEFFGFGFYWRSVDEMKADLDENWKDEVVIPQEVWRRTAELLAGHPGEKKLRLVVRMKLGVYKKTFDS